MSNKDAGGLPPTSAHNWAVILSQTQLQTAQGGLEPINEEDTSSQPTAAETIVDLLCEQGLNTFFGVPGGATTDNQPIGLEVNGTDAVIRGLQELRSFLE